MRRLLALVAVLLLGLLMPSDVRAQPSTIHPIAVSVDGATLGSSGLARAGQPPLVELEPLAAKLGWHVSALQGGARLQGDDRIVLLTVGSRSIRENGDLRVAFNEPPFEREGHIYVGAADAARLFGIRFSEHGGTLAFAHPPELESGTQITEIPKPVVPHPAPTKTPRQAPPSEAAQDARAGRVLLSLDRTGSLNLVHLSSETNGAYLHTNFDSSGVNQFGTPMGAVTVGSKQQNLSVGMIADPMSGLILRGGVFDGADYYAGRSQRSFFVGHRLDNGLSSAGVSVGSPTDGGSNTFEVLTQNGAFDQVLARHFVREQHPWGTFSQELLVGDRGMGIGFDSRTHGRTYVESTVTYATPGLPLGPDDAPISIDVGRDLSSATSVAAGMYTSPHQAIGPFIGMSTRASNLTASVSVTKSAATMSLAYQTPVVTMQLYSVPGIQRQSGLEGAAFLPGAVFNAEVQSSPGTREASVEMRTLRPGLNLITGISSPGSGRIGPVIGLSLPVTKMFALEGSLRPASGGGETVRVSLAAAIGGRRPRAIPTLPIDILIADAEASAPVRVFVDGVPSKALSGSRIAFRATRGQHVFSAQTLDGAYGSLDQTVSIEAPGDTVSLALLPERGVSGRVSVDPSAVVPPDFGLSNITVVIEPGDLSTVTADDGTFVFAKQPLAADSRIAVDSSSLPRELRAPDPIPLSDGPVELKLLPGLKIERRTF
jgi:hypothetical protein